MNFVGVLRQKRSALRCLSRFQSFEPSCLLRFQRSRLGPYRRELLLLANLVFLLPIKRRIRSNWSPVGFSSREEESVSAKRREAQCGIAAVECGLIRDAEARHEFCHIGI